MNYGHPWGRHGYHNTASSSNSYGGKGGLDVGDPLDIFPHDAQGNQARRGTAGDPGGWWYKPPSSPETPEQLAKDEEGRKTALRTSIDTLYGIGGSAEAQAAAKQMQDDQAGVSKATSDYYTDQLTRTATAAERNNRFNLARQGLLGGSVDVDSNTELATDKNLGATRIDQAARAAAGQLQAQREGERLNSVGLVNAGAGDEGVRAASAGLRDTLTNAQNANRTDLTGDLFTGFADNYALSNANAANSAALARYQQQLGAFFPTKASGGQVTPTA